MEASSNQSVQARRSAGQRADDLLPPGARSGVLLAGEAAARIALELELTADGHQRARDREAPVLQQHERAALVASRAHLLVHRDAVNLLREARVAVLLGPAPGGEHRSARAQGRVMRARDLHRPEPP